MALFRNLMSGFLRTCRISSSLVAVQTGIRSCVPKFGLQSLVSHQIQPPLGGYFLSGVRPLSTLLAASATKLLNPAPILVQPVRTRILFSYRGGKPRTVRAVVHRFFRLYNGLWIRARAGRHKKRWMKPLRRVQQLKQHVFVNRTQCRLLDRMVNKFYKTPKYYVDDPYAPYHRKSNLPDYRYEPPKFYP